VNWYKRARKYKDERFEGEKIDTQLLCCGYPENRREPYEKKKKEAERGRYRGQDPGDMYRGRGDVDQEFFDINKRELGAHVDKMRELMKIPSPEIRETKVNAFVEELKGLGYAMPIIQKLIITPAMYQFKFK